MSSILLALGTAGVAATAVLFTSCLRLAGVVAFVLSAYVFATVEVVVVSLALSPGSWLTRPALLAVIAAVLGVAVLGWFLAARPRPPGPGGLRVTVAEVLGDRLLVVL